MPQNKRKFVAWRLRLTKGAREASHDELENAGDWLENFETVCGAMVFFGVAFEVFIAAKNPAYGSTLERWGSSVADAFVALGVLGEVLASARGRVIQGELTRRSNHELAETRVLAVFADVEAGSANDAAARALRELADAKRGLAEATERAANAELQAAEARERTAAIERLTARRTIEPGRRSTLISELTDLLGFKVACIEYEIGDTEAWQLGSEIAEVFRRSHCLDVHGRSNSFRIVPMFGVFIGSSADVPIVPILQAFNKAGVTVFKTDIPASALVERPDISVYVFVAPKGPAELEGHFSTLSAAHVHFTGSAE